MKRQIIEELEEESSMNPGSLYVKHTLRGKFFYRMSSKDTDRPDETVTAYKPAEGFREVREEDATKGDEQWFDERWARLAHPFVKHTLGELFFFQRRGMDDTAQRDEPSEGVAESKEEDGANTEWFMERYQRLNPSFSGSGIKIESQRQRRPESQLNPR